MDVLHYISRPVNQSAAYRELLAHVTLKYF